MNRTNPKATYIIIASIIFIILGIVGKLDHEDEELQNAEYCEMVALWKADVKRGISEKYRTGWPPFRGECSYDSD